jgi:membrane protein YqaA with SNARE-associated domain
LFGRKTSYLKAMNKVFQPLYNWTLALAGHRHAQIALFLVAFTSSSFFPLPPDLLLMAMVVATPAIGLRLATIATLGSVLGAIGGWLIGYYLAPFGHYILGLYGLGEELTKLEALYRQWGLWCVAAGALTPLPYKLVTIGSGFLQFDLVPFVAISLLTRGARFFITAWLLMRFGPPIKAWIEERLALFATTALACLLGGFIIAAYLIPKITP